MKQTSIEEILGLEYLTVPELSKLIRKTPGAICNLVLRRAIPFRKPGGRLLFIRKEIDSWIKDSGGISAQELFDGRS